MSAGKTSAAAQREARAIDADIAEAVDAELASAPIDDAALERVRLQVWQTLSLSLPQSQLASPSSALSSSSTKPALTTRSASGSWIPFLPGVTARVLANEGGIATYLLRLQPHAVLPAHPHDIDEECYVLEGDLEIEGELTLSAGDFHLARAGRPHQPIRSHRGATILLRGASPF